MRPPLDPIYCTDDDDACFIADVPTSVAVTIGDRTIYVLADEAHYPPLKRKMTVTHRIEWMGPCCSGLYHCVMRGSDGSPLKIYLSAEDVYHNLRLAEAQMEMLYSNTVS